ncbi:MAG: hypothetical protein NZM25_02715 [Leptospiraceae bacterium]|nr:hypothetical protein [Leptospiraceae bacterium]MDW8307181.1 hypothetical protein [Leptospiraceae bacterium]
MKTIKLLAATITLMGLSAAGIAVPKDSANCVKIADLQVGNRLNTAAFEIVRSEILKEAQQIPADKVVVKLIRHEHGKLKTRYYAKAHALKCE